MCNVTEKGRTFIVDIDQSPDINEIMQKVMDSFGLGQLIPLKSTLVSDTLIENKPLEFDMVESFKTNFPEYFKND